MTISSDGTFLNFVDVKTTRCFVSLLLIIVSIGLISTVKMMENVQHYNHNIANAERCVAWTDMPFEIGSSEHLKIAHHR